MIFCRADATAHHLEVMEAILPDSSDVTRDASIEAGNADHVWSLDEVIELVG